MFKKFKLEQELKAHRQKAIKEHQEKEKLAELEKAKHQAKLDAAYQQELKVQQLKNKINNLYQGKSSDGHEFKIKIEPP